MPVAVPTLRAAVAVAALHALAATPLAAPAATLTPSTVPAAGRAAARLAVERAGRYSLAATSRTGVSLELVDRESGPGAADGAAGERDGRVDVLLDRGSYLLRTRGAEQAPGVASLEARPFRETAPEPPPALDERETTGATLGDLEQRSWLVPVDAAGTVLLEAAGRHLSDLRLWDRDGWLIDAAPEAGTLEPEPGRPLRALRIVARLEPGTYRVTAYGGPPEPWPAGGDARPLHVRRGIPRLGTAGRQRHVTGPFGVDRWLVPARANFLRVSLAEALPLVLEEAPFDEGAPAGGDPRARDEITKERREPEATIELDPEDAGWRLVTVRAAAGMPYLLQHFERRASYPFRASGPHWVGTVATGDPRDLVDETALLTRVGPGAGARPETVRAQVVEVDARRGWARRTNLLEPLSVFLRAGETGAYEVLLSGAAARARILPFFTGRPRDFREPPWQSKGGRWDLSAGLYVLEVEPVEPGIAEVAVRRAGTREPAPAPAQRPGALFGEVPLDWTSAYTLHLNERPGVRRGIVLRPLPVDLAEPLPLVLASGEEVAVPALLPADGTVRAITDDGRPLALALEGGWTEAARLPAGRHTLRVRNTGAAATWAALAFEAAPAPAAPAPAAPSPGAPALAEGRALFLDLARGGSAPLDLAVAEPAFYTLESTGLLAVAGSLGTRTFPALARDEGGGTGRNFSIGRYLGGGDYRLTVSAQGLSAGRLGVSLHRAPLRSGGALRPGIAARAALGPGEGILYELSVAAAGRWSIRAEAPGRVVPLRLEDADGWPLIAPGTPADLEMELEPGRYRVLLMPEPLASRRVIVAAPVTEPPARTGHGPHPVALGVAATHVWMEPQGDAPRAPDLWELVLPAAAEVTVALDAEMEGLIRPRLAVDAGNGIRVPPGRPWKGRLPAGAHVLEVVCSRRNDRAPYTVEIDATELLAGSSRNVVPPASLPIAIGSAGLYELATAGSADVRIRLLDAGGAALAAQEDRPDDWNAQLAVRLEPGTYRVEVEAAPGEPAPAVVSLREIRERPAEPLATPARREARPGDDALVAPLLIPAAARLLLLVYEADETAGVSVERTAGGAVESLWSATGRSGAVEIPLAAPGERRGPEEYRVRTWSLDRAGGGVRLALGSASLPRVTEAELARGVDVPAAAALPRPVAAVELVPERAGTFALDGAAPWRSSPVAGRPLASLAPSAAPIPAGGALLALTLEEGAKGARLRGARMTMPPGEARTFELPADGSAIAVDLQRSGNGPLLAVARSVAGRPVVALAPAKGAPARPPATAAGVAPHSAAALLPEGEDAAALVWEGSGPGSGSVAELRVHAFPARPPREGAAGVTGGTLAAGEALALRLPRGPSRLRIALAPGLAAALSRHGEAESTHWADAGALDETVESGADLFTLVNPGATAASWSLEAIPLSGRRRAVAISDGWPHVASFPGAGTVRLPVAADEGEDHPPSRLRVAGTAGTPLMLGTDGRVRSGDRLAVAAGGTLLLPHGPGTAAAWVEHEGDATPGLWGSARASDWRDVAPPEIVPLRGASVGLRFEAREAAGLHLRFERPAVTLVRRPGSAPLAALHPDAVRLDTILPPGTTEVLLRSPDGEDLRGRAEAVRSTIARLGEGAGPETVLAAGTTVFFSFAVASQRQVGVGVRSVPDTATCALLDAGGAVLGTGIVQMRALPPGTYYLAVSAPAGGGTITVRPAVAGIGPPPAGPPDEVVRRYLEMERSETTE